MENVFNEIVWFQIGQQQREMNVSMNSEAGDSKRVLWLFKSILNKAFPI